MIKVKKLSDGIFEVIKDKKQLATKNLDPGRIVYGEKLIPVEGIEYRTWDPRRSKLGAMILKKFNIPLKADSKVLYLGAASGTTVSHVSDIVSEGAVYAVEFAPRSMRDLIRLASRRKNIYPILADAGKPESYSHLVEPVDLIFQDVAQPNQAEIAARNAARFLKKDGNLMLSIKARSIDTAANPKEVFKAEVKKLKQAFEPKFEILNAKDLKPYHEDHLGILAKLK
ncbi:rRNA 2'-O-methyltransferase fibrillarin [Methanosarcina thermophila]|jgi:fibrillarin-like pre-rRNA processing protein|uniref:Fibrillarin-like rRNA/tRNA 2'-O-methyltransferase n=3 Tax=Methanosarcina thermophila TaxID=2210 RepID=A0A1I6YQ20_METTE|nr:fibrillarin-like rRNA/tRNA 2'-O-methyltransferase [Methanosarcina thermophila]AKB13924.1 Fibrillarin [Methanosarcina thermophila TM-1]AKB15431.1 Fibrillarin [Methanosarcina thermophila CHTI-55]SFT52291.1 rRNA 2'-O-methyltransferase fibrillarin [Methanosarcina thermophila]BAW28966.1 rRNA 2'-O-methyltransferase fibrillarin [Methanosarcina thermophila]GLI14571.1 fibrillarin-like rRNA methylase [Methanosarcina thermophila MST-A1]